MARLETWYKQDLKRPLVVHKHTDVFNQDSKGNLIGVEVYIDGEPVVLAGSISGYCLLADGTTVPAVGASRSGNKASVLIPQTAYSVPGPITITIKNVEGDNITTLCATVGIVRQSVSGNFVNPGSVVTDWSNNINAQLQAIQTAADNVGAIVAAPFDENTVYVVGNYVTNNGNLYRITADHAVGVAWADTAKVQCTVGNELFELKSAIVNTNDLIDQGFKTIRNLLYTGGNWLGLSASGVLNETGLTVTATTEGNKYPSYQFFLDVTGIDSVTLSFESITQGEGTNARIRYGKEDSTGTEWFGFATSPCTIDTSAFYTLKIAFYVYFNKAAVEGVSATFVKPQVEIGTVANDFVAGDKIVGLNIRFGEGNTSYMGERLQIGQLNSLYKCNVDIWKNFTNDSSHNLHQNQSIACYGNYVFILLNGGTIHILDKTTKEIIASMELSTVSSNHQNSAQFLDGIYAEDGDEFPILMISRCGNSATSSSSPLPGTDCALMTRVQKSGNDWTITNLGTIIYNVTTWGSSWAVDMSGKRLINISLQNGTYSVTENNPIVVTVFNLPTKDKYTGHALTLNESNAIAKAYLHHFTFQSLYANGDLLYMPAKTSNGNYLYVFSISRNAIVTIVPLEDIYEPEGFMIMDNAMFISMRQGTDSAGVNPLRIYSISN